MRAQTHNRWITLITVIFTLVLVVQGLWAQEATPETGSNVCVSGPGFWANNPNAWTVTSLTLGSQSYTQAELVAILVGSSDGDASLILARQLIAAKLNVAAGTSSAVIDGLISAGDALLIGFSGTLPYNVEPSSATGQSMTALASTLDSFNAGNNDDDDDGGDCIPTVTPEATGESTVEATPEITPQATPDVRFCDDDDDDDDHDDDDSDDDDDCEIEITIIIEGPVEEINANIIVIYGFNIELNPNDPLLVVIQVGDIVRIEGNIDDDDTTIVIIAVIVIIVDIDVVVSEDGAVWRDEGNCNNPPPPWAPAHGWRRRCESGGNGGGSGSGRGGSGRGGGSGS